MLKYYDFAVTFAEFPDEIALCINITGCPNKCKDCSEPWLQADQGNLLDKATLTELVQKNPGITLVGLMGGDQSIDDVVEITEFIHQEFPFLKVGMYSGKEFLDTRLLNKLDYYKIGSWITPEGSSENWWKTNCGPISFTFSNQLMFKHEGTKWVNITGKFRKKPLNNLERQIIKRN